MSNLYLLVNGNVKCPITFTTFSDGAENCNIGAIYSDSVVLVVDVEDCTRDIMRMMLVKEALEASGIEAVSLTINYFPNARCDRRFGTGEGFPLKVFAKMVNSCNFDSVYITDPHSDVTPALIDRVQVITQNNSFRNLRHKIRDGIGDNYIICAPDLGATKKAEIIANGMDKPLIQAFKHRDIKTGKITSTSVNLPIKYANRDVLIVDDICDGGATFSYLATELLKLGAKSVSLYITHGIFAKGLQPLTNLNKIYVSHLNETYINRRDIEKFNER